MSIIFEKESISATICTEMIGKAVTKAQEIGFGISITIVDEGGVTKAFHRMDNAPLVSIDASRKKAVTAVGFGMPTGDSWYGFIKDDPILMNGAGHLEDFILLGGGSPLMVNEKLVGAIGISGGHYKQDEECVTAALSIL
ncbi:MAG TPA: heme-binding protein [Flavobacteriales bacterium]|nr:heme-binding protein [Flavobacteriales bacterium]HIN39882.1 heme-binding protein [Flavobacteriales bacterium]